DDFGTGFASLSFLTTMPLTHLKIDRSFVHELPASRSHAAVVKALIRMADELGLCVIAEGVENSSQEKYLQEHGCALAQGFLSAARSRCKTLKRCWTLTAASRSTRAGDWPPRPEARVARAKANARAFRARASCVTIARQPPWISSPPRPGGPEQSPEGRSIRHGAIAKPHHCSLS
ncbi:MAG: EAL domain-containing protein, partial [Alphaproteobacteria bacterium]